jgi:hypothetical protein
VNSIPLSDEEEMKWEQFITLNVSYAFQSRSQ